MLNQKELKAKVKENAEKRIIKDSERIKHEETLKMQALAIEVNEINIKQLIDSIANLVQEQQNQNHILMKEIEAKNKAEKREKRNFWIAIFINGILGLATLISIIVTIINGS